jgi:hypothetical protein
MERGKSRRATRLQDGPNQVQRLAPSAPWRHRNLAGQIGRKQQRSDRQRLVPESASYRSPSHNLPTQSHVVALTTSRSVRTRTVTLRADFDLMLRIALIRQLVRASVGPVSPGPFVPPISDRGESDLFRLVSSPRDLDGREHQIPRSSVREWAKATNLFRLTCLQNRGLALLGPQWPLFSWHAHHPSREAWRETTKRSYPPALLTHLSCRTPAIGGSRRALPGKSLWR